MTEGSTLDSAGEETRDVLDDSIGGGSDHDLVIPRGGSLRGGVELNPKDLLDVHHDHDRESFFQQTRLLDTTEVDIRDSRWWELEPPELLHVLNDPLLPQRDDLLSSKELQQTLTLLRRIELAMIGVVLPYAILYICSTFMESLGDSLVFLVVLRAIGLILLVALITAFFFVGGRKNVDWRIVRELTRTWRVYVIAVAVVGNVVVDYVGPTPDFRKVHEIDTLVFALCMFWFVIQDAIIYLSKTFRILSTFVVAVGVPFLCFEAYMYGGEVKSLIYSQILIIASTAVKRVLTDSERRYLHLPTKHCRRRPIEHQPVSKCEALTIGLMVCSAIVGMAFNSHIFGDLIPVELVLVLEVLPMFSLLAVYWRNVDGWVLRRLLCSYEAIVVIGASAVSVVIWYRMGTPKRSENRSMNHADRVIHGFVLSFSVILFVISDCLKVRSLWFRKFCYLIFMLFLVLQLVMTLNMPNQKVDISGLGYINAPLALFQCYLQVMVIAVPALYCVLTDGHQQKLALLRCPMLRPPDPAGSLSYSSTDYY